MEEKLLNNKKNGMAMLLLLLLVYIAAIVMVIFGGIGLDNGSKAAIPVFVVGLIWVCLGWIAF